MDSWGDPLCTIQVYSLGIVHLLFFQTSSVFFLNLILRWWLCYLLHWESRSIPHLCTNICVHILSLSSSFWLTCPFSCLKTCSGYHPLCSRKLALVADSRILFQRSSVYPVPLKFSFKCIISHLEKENKNKNKPKINLYPSSHSSYYIFLLLFIAKKILKIDYTYFSSLSLSIMSWAPSNRFHAHFPSLKPLLSMSTVIFLLLTPIEILSPYHTLSSASLLWNPYLYCKLSSRFVCPTVSSIPAIKCLIGFLNLTYPKLVYYLLPQASTCLPCTLFHPRKWHHHAFSETKPKKL